MGPLEFGYQGLPRDPETGLIYFRNRYYDPELGRFITADPKEYADGPSMYGFERNDPTNGSDPLGFGDVEQIPVVGPIVAGAEEVGEGAGDAGVVDSTYNGCVSANHNDATDLEEMTTTQDQASVNARAQSGAGRRCIGKITRKSGSAVVHGVKAGGYALDAASEFQIYRGALRVAIAAGKSEVEALKIAREAVAKAKKDVEEKAAAKEVRLLPAAVWTATDFSPGELDAHFAKHAFEWGSGNITKEAYLKRARGLLNSKVDGDILGYVRPNGDVLRYNQRTNEFAVASSEGTIRTFFRPKEGLNYWQEQVTP